MKVLPCPFLMIALTSIFLKMASLALLHVETNRCPHYAARTVDFMVLCYN